MVCKTEEVWKRIEDNGMQCCCTCMGRTEGMGSLFQGVVELGSYVQGKVEDVWIMEAEVQTV